MKTNFAQLFLAFAVGVLATSGVLITNLHAGQPHMEDALSDLQSARHQLEIAKEDKGGHRSRAISSIDDAIHEVKAGINYAN